MAILVILLVLALLYLLYKLVVFVRADADLTLLSRTLDTCYFDNKVVWVTGASSGSELVRALKDIMECILLLHAESYHLVI